MTRSIKLAGTDLVQISHNRCTCGRSGCGQPRGGKPLHLALTSRGAFGLRVGARDHVAEPFRGILNSADTEYSVSHPAETGHDYTIVEGAPELWDEALFGGTGLRREREISYGVAGHYAHLKALAELRATGPGNILATEEIAMTLLRRVTQDAAGPLREHALHRAQVDRIRQLIVSRLTENIGLQLLADEASCSPFHLTRLFRSQTGRSIRRFRLESRIALALSLMAAGQDNLSFVALDCGFSNHSHMTEAFRTVFKQSPSQARKGLVVEHNRFSQPAFR